ncbi:Nuclear receptor coactivator 4 [Bagarius yarrelli]|uniref:Nuclear receptor coactivator 4 n=1 Tax=Bagarius yarrelli TaxID=175774 RepID=A0A556TR70_BAGYA|nr:Nuclear receptor coactivator 4 [Bagarius yarrelli]
MLSPEEQENAALRQCVQAQAQLEEAITKVVKAEAQLRGNSREVKFQLHSCISRHLETLRSREVWLLEQIDLLEHLKAEALQQQLLQLHWVLKTSVSNLTSQRPSSAEKTWIVQNCLKTLKRQKLDQDWGGPLAEWYSSNKPGNSAPIGYQSSNNPQDWLLTPKEKLQVQIPCVHIDFQNAWGQRKDLEACS